MTDQRDPIYQEALTHVRGMFEEARLRELTEPHAASLATTDLRGQPSIRTISVVAIEDTGPLFFIDSRSGKGRQLEENPCAALCFFWPELRQQVVIEGHVATTAGDVADHFWAGRPREGQLAAWASEPAFRDGKDASDDPLAAIRARFASRPVPRPPHWQALYLCPDVMLFWKPGWRSLHARERYFRDRSGHWRHESMRPL